MHPVDLELGCFSCSYFENMKAPPRVPPGPVRFLEVPLGPSSWAAGLSSSNFRTQPRRLATRHRRGHMGHLGLGGPAPESNCAQAEKPVNSSKYFKGVSMAAMPKIRPFLAQKRPTMSLACPTCHGTTSWSVWVCVCTVHTAIGSIDIHVTWTSQKWNMKRKPIPAVLCFADERILDGRKMTLNNMAEEGSKSSGCWIWHRCSHPHKVAKECPKLWHKKLERSLHQLLDVDWQKDYCW